MFAGSLGLLCDLASHIVAAIFIQSVLEHCISAAVIIWVNCRMTVCEFVDGLSVSVGSALESCFLSHEVSMQSLNSKVFNTQWGRMLS